MALNGYKLDPDYLNYEADFNTVLFGIKDYKSKIHLLDLNNNSATVNVYYFRNVEINNKNEISVAMKPSTNAFNSFEDYYGKLVDAVKQMAENSRDEHRSYKYGMTTTISKGYDALCCAAVAKLAGCDTAVTFAPNGKYADDCGTEVAAILGYTNIFERDALDFKNRTDCVEAMYVASGELGADISLSAFDKEFQGNLVFTGDRGDSIWGRQAYNFNGVCSFESLLSHLGCVERRLWLGYISVPMPLYGATAWPSLFEIANSEEMKPWQLEGWYDRPIPRRIIEQSGVPRDAFGMVKHGAGFVYKFDWMSRIKAKMSDTTIQSFEAYVKKHKKPHPIQLVKFFWGARAMFLGGMGIKTKLKTSLEYCQISNATAVRYLIPWAGEVVLERYKNILKAED